MSTGKVSSLSRNKMKQIRAEEGTAQTEQASRLRTGLIEAGSAIELVPSPAALWSLDRHSCHLNDDARELLGFCEHDFKQDGALWLERIHPDDRKEFLRAWKSLQAGETRVSSCYRFQPKNRTQVLWLKEVSILYASSGVEKPNVWTVYLEEMSENVFPGASQMRNFVRGLTHEMGNNLQAIRGELDILRFSQAIPNDSAETIYRGINQVRRLVHEIQEYLLPPSVEATTEDPASVLAEVIQSREKEMAAHGIRTGMKFKESLPKVPLDLQFGRALTNVIDFSRALLAKGGGELNIDAGVCRRDGENYIELNIVSSSETSLQVDEGEVFRPFASVNGHRAGLSMAVAQQILKRHFGKIVFRKEQSNRGVFSLLIRVPNSAEPSMK